MTDKKLDLIAQLLAKAERTTPEEAEALTAAAAKLMLKYGIEQARIDEARARSGKATEQIIKLDFALKGTYAVALRDGLAECVFALGTMRVMQSGYSPTRQWLWVVGYESDVSQTLVLLQSLQLQAMVAMRHWWKSVRARYAWASDWEKEKARADFILGFGAGAATRIRANRRQVVEEAGTGTDLVLASRRSRVDEHVDALDIPTARVGKKRIGHSWSDGHRAGQEANTGEKQIDGQRALAGA